MDRKRQVTSRTTISRVPSRADLLDRERGTYLKKWKGLLPVGLFYPNHYRVGMSNLGLQLVYRMLNEYHALVCERLFLPETDQPLVSVESGRPPADFPIIFISISFEHDYLNLARFFLTSGLEPLANRREESIEPGNPLVVCGGVAAFMNPEPLAPFVDLFVVGEAEPLLPKLIDMLCADDFSDRRRLLSRLNRDHDGFYAPQLYQPRYDSQNRFEKYEMEPGLPERIRRIGLETTDFSAHSELLTPETEFSDLYLSELGRGCSRGCRFCTAGFVYRPPRLWDIEAILKSLEKRPRGIDRIGLLGMEMTSRENLDLIAGNLGSDGCSLSFSSLRADRISDNLLELLQASNLKSVAIAPDGASERLRRVINKQLTESDLLAAAEKLTEAGLHRLKLYLMIGLPTETFGDLEEFVDLVQRIRDVIHGIGRKRGRLSEISISVNSFVPKPWTPFQYHPFGASEELDGEETLTGRDGVQNITAKIKYLRTHLASLSNLRLKFDNPDQALFQSILSRGDRRLAQVLLIMADSGISWKQALKQSGLSEQLFATRQFTKHSPLVWTIVDHGIKDGYLWREYRRSFEEKETPPCDTGVCRICGVCRD
ncbi:MAG: radical SAM protein [Desulfocapsaceae bacterium]